MPRTRRSKIVSLTKTKKKAPEHKELLVTRIRQALKKYDRVIVFSHQNMTTVPFRELQQQWKDDSKFFLGKLKVVQVALGKDEESTATRNSYLLTKHCKGERGLLFTNKTADQVEKLFAQFKVEEYPRAGEIANQTIVLEKGHKTFELLSHSIEPYLRQLGLNTQLNNQLIILQQNFIASQEGKELSVEQCKLLRLLNMKISHFTLKPICVLQKNGSFKMYV